MDAQHPVGRGVRDHLDETVGVVVRLCPAVGHHRELANLVVDTRRLQFVLGLPDSCRLGMGVRSEEHTSELQSLMRISYAVFCLKQKKSITTQISNVSTN